MAKAWYKSKTVWANAISMVGILLSNTLGVTLTPEQVGAILVVINLILRIVTKEEIVWKE